MAKKPIALIIMDGYGINQNTEGNAIVAAKKPHLDKLLAEYPHSQLSASGLDVGLPDGQMGNSEVGHTNIGAGRIVYQMLVKISKDINDGKITKTKLFQTLWMPLKLTANHFTLWDFFQTAVYTATTNTSTVC